MEQSEKFARDFFEATSHERREMHAGEPIAPAPPFLSYENAERVALPELKEEAGPGLWQAMAGRRSVRTFRDTSISLEQLTRLLWAAQGVTARSGECLFRTTPSAGAHYPCETYVLVNRVEGLEPGSYHLCITDWTLEFIKPGDLAADLVRAAMGQKFLGQAPVVLAWTAICGRVLWRYRERGIRYIFQDAGHIGQNVALAAVAMGLGCCAVGAYYDDEVAEVIGIDREREYPVYLNAVGVAR